MGNKANLAMRSIGFALAALTTGVLIMANTRNSAEERLLVKYSMSLLKATPAIFDPTDHASIVTYYLAENLGAGLVRDDVASPTGFRAALAESWTWDGNLTWRFKIRPHLRWSDGTEMSGADFINLIDDLRTGNHRHLLALKRISQRSYDDSTRILSLTFSQKTTESVLHELSLADSVLYKRGADGSPRWDITSGPYYVSEYRPRDFLDLAANVHSPLYAPDAPEKVRLVPLFPEGADPYTRTLGDADIVRIPTPTYASASQNIMKSAPLHKEGAWSMIYYFHVNPKHRLASDPIARAELRDLIQGGLRSASLPQGIKSEDQMVPPAYDGRLPTVEVTHPKEIRVLRGKTVILGVNKSFRDLGERVIAQLEQSFRSHGAELKIREHYSDDPDSGNEILAWYDVFAGNQSDVGGSWTFHFTKGGALTPFREEYAYLIDEIAKATEKTERSHWHRELHHLVLDKAHMIPVFSGMTCAVHSARVKLDRWNPFDMRMRFYEVRWK